MYQHQFLGFLINFSKSCNVSGTKNEHRQISVIYELQFEDCVFNLHLLALVQ